LTGNCHGGPLNLHSRLQRVAVRERGTQALPVIGPSRLDLATGQPCVSQEVQRVMDVARLVKLVRLLQHFGRQRPQLGHAVQVDQALTDAQRCPVLDPLAGTRSSRLETALHGGERRAVVARHHVRPTQRFVGRAEVGQAGIDCLPLCEAALSQW
jgi:hypothetical protein